MSHLYLGNFLRQWLVACVLMGCCVITMPVNAQTEKDQRFGDATTARWRVGDVLVTESQTDGQGWLTLGCEGDIGVCDPTMDSIRSALVPKEWRVVGNSLQVRAEEWKHGHFMRLGPLQAATDLSIAPGPWLDARFSALRCNWVSKSGRHQLSFAGGATADYLGPQGSARQLNVVLMSACSRCRAIDFINVELKDLKSSDFNELSVHLDIQGVDRSDHAKLRGGVSWSNEQPIEMQCVAQ